MYNLTQNIGLFADYYELTMAQGYYLKERHELNAGFDYFFRKAPFNGAFVIFTGLEDLLEMIKKFRFGTEECQYLLKLGFNKSFVDYLKEFEFKGNIYAPEEGQVVFPIEPVMHVEGTILEAQLIETLLLNIINFQSLIATKAARIRYAAGDKPIIDFGLRRAQGLGGLQHELLLLEG